MTLMTLMTLITYLVIPASPFSLIALLSRLSSGRETLSPGHCTENHSLCSLTELDLPPEHIKDPWLPPGDGATTEDPVGLLPQVGRDP